MAALLKLSTCPYNPAHRMDARRLSLHIIKCRKNNKHMSMETCPFNATHIVPTHQFKAHIMECPDNEVVLKNLVNHEDSDTTTTSCSEESDEEEAFEPLQPPLDSCFADIPQVVAEDWCVGNVATSTIKKEGYNLQLASILKPFVRNVPSGLSKAARKQWTLMEKKRIKELQEGLPFSTEVRAAFKIPEHINGDVSDFVPPQSSVTYAADGYRDPDQPLRRPRLACLPQQRVQEQQTQLQQLLMEQMQRQREQQKRQREQQQQLQQQQFQQQQQQELQKQQQQLLQRQTEQQLLQRQTEQQQRQTEPQLLQRQTEQQLLQRQTKQQQRQTEQQLLQRQTEQQQRQTEQQLLQRQTEQQQRQTEQQLLQRQTEQQQRQTEQQQRQTEQQLLQRQTAQQQQQQQCQTEQQQMQHLDKNHCRQPEQNLSRIQKQFEEMARNNKKLQSENKKLRELLRQMGRHNISDSIDSLSHADVSANVENVTAAIDQEDVNLSGHSTNDSLGGLLNDNLEGLLNDSLSRESRLYSSTASIDGRGSSGSRHSSAERVSASHALGQCSSSGNVASGRGSLLSRSTCFSPTAGAANVNRGGRGSRFLRSSGVDVMMKGVGRGVVPAPWSEGQISGGRGQLNK